MLEIKCSGTPTEVIMLCLAPRRLAVECSLLGLAYAEMLSVQIGQWHGRLAAPAVKRSIEFYKDLFMRETGISWLEVCSIAKKFDPFLEGKWQCYVEEMKGIDTKDFPCPFESFMMADGA